MFREEWDGASYLVHMAINRNGWRCWPYQLLVVPYIKKEIVDALGIDPLEINTSEKVYDLAVKIKEGNISKMIMEKKLQ